MFRSDVAPELTQNPDKKCQNLLKLKTKFCKYGLT